MDRQQSLGLEMLLPREGGRAARVLSGVSAGVSGISSQTGKTLRHVYRGVYNALKRERKSEGEGWFNPERQAAQKREWLENRLQQEKTRGWPEHCFEHLVIAGLSPSSDIEGIAADLRNDHNKKKAGAAQAAALSRVTSDKVQHHAPVTPSYTPEILYQFPEDKPLHMSEDQLASFCFPQGVTPSLLARTPSMSALNEIIYGQQHLMHSDKSFVFMQKGGDDLPMFGVCYYVPQMLHTPPSLAKARYPDIQTPITKHLVAAHRCYCLLSRYPFFKLHFQVLNVVIGFERLDTISDFMQEVASRPPKSNLSQRLGFTSVSPTVSPSPSTCSSAVSHRDDLHERFPVGRHRRPFSASPSFFALASQLLDPIPSSTPLNRGAEVADGNQSVRPQPYDLSRRSLGFEVLKHGEQGSDQDQFGGKASPTDTPSGHASVQDSVSSIPCMQRSRLREIGGFGGFISARSALCAPGLPDARCHAAESVRAEPSSGCIAESDRTSDHAEAGSGPGGSATPKSKSSTGYNNAGLGVSPFAVQRPGEPATGGAASGPDIAREMESPRPNNWRRIASGSGPRDPAIASDVDSGASCSTIQALEQRRRAALGVVSAHVRSVSGQSLRGFEDDDGFQEPSFSDRVSPLPEEPGVLIHTDNAFHPVVPPCPEPPGLGLALCDASFSQWPFHRSDSEACMKGGSYQPWSAAPPSPRAPGPPPRAGDRGGVYRSSSAEDLTGSVIKRWGSHNMGEEEVDETRLSPPLCVLMGYYCARVPAAGEKFTFLPDDGLQPIEYMRAKVKPLGRCNSHPEDDSQEGMEQSVLSSQIALIDAETAANLRLWSITALCKSLSIENVLSLLAALMLEKQIVFFSPNVGILSAAVLAVIPLLKPYVWQSLIMPVVPSRLLELLDAPVPFAVGLQHKTADVVQKCADLVRVNLYKDGIKNAPPASVLPKCKRLHASLGPWHRRLREFKGYCRRPVHFVSPGEEEAAEGFLHVIGDYLHDLCGDIRQHTITDVGPTEHVTVLLEDSLVESFPPKDVPFMRSFAQTQMFSSFVDASTS